MDTVDESSAGVVALLLDDLAPPRLGTLLRAARKERGSTRREIANRVGTSASDLRRYERGDEPVPPAVIAALAECYGEDLTTQLATRAPIQVDADRLVVGTEIEVLESDDSEVLLTRYVGIVSRLRQSQPGEPIGLRADDLVALSNALGQDSAHVEARIAELLGCTAYEAHSLHAEMLRRKLVLPVAGLVAGIAMVAGVGVGVAGASTNPSAHRPHAPHAVATPVADSDTQRVQSHIAAAHITAAHIAAGHVVTAVSATPPTTVVETPHASPAAPSPTTAERITTESANPVPRPVIGDDSTPMSIPGNETVTIIQP